MARSKLNSPKNKQSTQNSLKKDQKSFHAKIVTLFTNMGFHYFKTSNKNIKIEHKTTEIDALFVYENIMIICEESCAGGKDKAHIRQKKSSCDAILNNRNTFIEELKKICPTDTNILEAYPPSRFQIYYLYCPLNELNLSGDEYSEFQPLKFIEPQVLNYFSQLAKSIKRSAKYEMFKFLGLKKEDIGVISSNNSQNQIKAPIIYPEEITGNLDGIRVVSFMMSAQKLLETCYVLRKDNWEDSLWLYQRLIDEKKIKAIRNFLLEKQQAFYNNIIVALPDDVKFTDEKGTQLQIDKVSNFKSGAQLQFPNEFNSICVIDGQHRIFSHFEGDLKSQDEIKIAKLRGELHLLVTGLIFPSKLTDLDRAKKQSEIFLDINNNTKSIPPDLLLHIEMLKDPFSDIGIARSVLKALNKQAVFKDSFEFSGLERAKIKTASIIKFALKHLVSAEDANNKKTLFYYWTGNKNDFSSSNENALNDYIEFCASTLDIYFSAIKKIFKTFWNDKNSKILSVIVINGLIMAFQNQLEINKIQNFSFYEGKFKSWNCDFSKTNFKYTSSQYRLFSKEILKDVFGIY